MIRDPKGVPLAAVIRKDLIPPPSISDPAFGERYSEYASHDDEMIARAPILDRDTYDHKFTPKMLEKSGPFDPRHLAVRAQVWKIIKRCVGTNNKLSLQIKQWTKTTDGRAAYLALETFLLGNGHATSQINAAEKLLATTTFQHNKKGWTIKDYVTTHIQGYATIHEQMELGNHAGMHERRRVDLLLDGVKNQWLGGVKSNILCQPNLFNDFNATANHLKDCVNRMPPSDCSW